MRGNFWGGQRLTYRRRCDAIQMSPMHESQDQAELRPRSRTVEALPEEVLEEILRRVPPIIRLPRPGTRCPFTGLSRTGLTEIIAPCKRNGYKPPVPVSPHKRNERVHRGVYLIPAARLFRYLLAVDVPHTNRDIEL